jgi:hypothetical protein
MAAAAELTRAIHDNRCRPYCEGVVIRSDLAPRLLVVAQAENDGRWTARIENTSYAAVQPVDVWEFKIDEVKALLPRANDRVSESRADDKEKPRRDPPEYGKIRQKARELYPQGYDHEKTNVLIDNVYTALGADAPKSREVGERALGRRKR